MPSVPADRGHRERGDPAAGLCENRLVVQSISAAREAALSRLISAALDRTELSVLRDMLLVVAQSVRADGCALWQVQPSGRTPTGATATFSVPDDARIFVLAAGVPGDLVCAYHNVPMTSATGTAMRCGRVSVPDISRDPRVGMTGQYLLGAGIQSLGSVRILMDDGMPGAITVYRKSPGDMAESDFQMLEFLGSHIPALYRTVRDGVSFKLIEEVDARIHEAEFEADLPPHIVKKMMEAVCMAVASGFQCLEASIYLENPLEAPGTLRLMGTTCPAFIRKEQYKPGDYGLTPWIWAKRKPIRVFDLKDFDQSEYEDLDWRDDVRVQEQTRRLLRLSSPAELPPISFMAVPIIVGKHLLGVFRCCAARCGPYYFAEREVNLLEIIASHIGHFWSNALRRQELSSELTSWNAFVRLVSRLNVSVQQSLTGAVTDHTPILEQALDVIQKAIPGADILDVSLFIPETRRLEVAAYRGAAWLAGGDAAIQARRQALSYAADEDPPTSPAALVFKKKTLIHVWSRADSGPQYTTAFPGVRQAILSPVLSDQEVLGMLAVRGTQHQGFPRQTEAMVELLSHQLGLYLRLALSLKQQTETYRDFQHQLRSPVFQAYKRMLQVRAIEKDFNLEAVRGLLGKAGRVVTNLGLYASIAGGRKIELSLQRLSLPDLIKRLIEAATDNRILWRHRRISFRVDKESFGHPTALRVDMDILEEAVNNVLDNAGKYAFSGTVVRISARAQANRRVAICVRSRGIPLTAAEVTLAPRREWRGEIAKRCAGEGSGIGLWIVDHIMLAHRGELEIIPTDAEGCTEVRLGFPEAA